MINIRSAEIRENQRATEVRSCFPLTGHCPASVPGFYPESSWDELLLLSAPWNQHPDTEITMTGTTASPQRSVSSQSLHSVSQLLLWLDKATPTLIYNHHPTHPSAPSCWAKFNLWLPPSPFPTVELCISTSTTRASGKVSCCSSKNQLEEAFTLIINTQLIWSEHVPGLQWYTDITVLDAQTISAAEWLMTSRCVLG